MAASSTIFPTASLIPTEAFSGNLASRQQFLVLRNRDRIGRISQSKPTTSLKIRAAKLPAGVEAPKVEPKFEAPFLGFTTTAEIWNSRVCMIGLIGTLVVELIMQKGVLQVIGVEVGKGLNLPL